MTFRGLVVAGLSAAVAWGGFVLADQPAAYAICNDPCGGGGGVDPAVHTFVDLTVQGMNTTTTAGSVTGGHLASACSDSCTDAWSDTVSTEEADVTYTVTPASGWAIDRWTGCSSGGGTGTTCTVTPKYTTSLTKTSDNTVAVGVYLRDSTPPTVQFTTGPQDYSYTRSTGFTFGWSVDGTGTAVTSTQCKEDSGAYFTCNGWTTWSNAPEGFHTFSVKATDGGGNITIATRHVTVDTTPPAISVNGPSAGSYVASNSANVSFSGSDVDLDHADCGDGATDAAHVSPTRSNCGWYYMGFPVGWTEYLSNLPEGIHTWTVRMVDQAGNTSELWRTWYVDTVAPTATFTGGPDDGATTSDTNPTFDFTPDGTGSTATASCSLTGPVAVAEGPCTTDTSETLSGLTNGAYTLTLNLTDQAGNTATVSRNFTVDTSVPTLSIDSGPDAGSYLDSNSATFGFTPDQNATSVTCALDDQAFRACSGATSDALTNLADGPHTWTVKVANSAGTATQLTRSFTVDTTDPTAAFTNGPDADSQTNNASPMFGWTADGTGSPAVVTCKLDTGTFGACTSPTTEQLSSLSDGAHTFSIQVTDAIGRTVTISRTFTVDTIPPAVVVAAGPDNGDAIATRAASYFFSADAGTAFQCATDSDTFGACTGTGNDDLTALADGVHAWHLQATDVAGNVTTVDRSFTVDTTAPTAAFTSGVADNGFTNDTTPALGFATDGTGTDTTSACSVDAGTAAPCTTASSYVTAVLAEGVHTVHVAVTDAAGNSVTISRTFTVDTTPPTLTVLSGPAQNGAIAQTDVTFGFSAENGTSIGCSLDTGDYVLCSGTGADTTTGLAEGTHTWHVRATDPAGNHTIVSRTFTIDLTKPHLTVTTSWPKFVLSRTLTFTWNPYDAGSGVKSSDVQVQHATPGGGFGSWSSPTGWTATTAPNVSFKATLGNTYCVHVRTRDKAGNTTAWSSSRCTALPLDDRSLGYSAHWKKITARSFFNRTASQTSTRHATLTSHTVQAKRISVLVTTCRGCGTIGVYRGTTLLKKLSLSATTTHRRVLLTVWSGSSVRTGIIRIKVLSASGHLVQIDGLAVSRR